MSMPPVMLGATELQGARDAVAQAIGHLKAAQQASTEPAGGEHTQKAIDALETALRHVDDAIKLHKG